MRVASFVLILSLTGCEADSPGGRGRGPDDDPGGGGPSGMDLDQDGHRSGADCDDTNPFVHPGAEEVPYDGIDQDCVAGDLVDVDRDGAVAVEADGDDCDDRDPAIHPKAVDVPYDGVDQDCAGGDLVDADGDGVDGVEAGGSDCDDRDPWTAPGAADTVGDGIDQSCDGVDGIDADRDVFASTASGGDDCDDLDPTVNPGVVEVWYDGVDQDCDGACDGDQDGDGSMLDGWTVTDGDICDGDPEAGLVLAPTDCDDTDPLAEALLLSTLPTDGETDANPWRAVQATLYEPDTTATLTVVDSAGVPVAGSATWSGATLAFAPVAQLQPLAAYTATLTWGCGTEEWSFTTNDGTGQDFLYEWTVGPPDTLRLELVNPMASLYGFGMAETAAGAVGWYGEDCAGDLSTGACHPVAFDELLLESVAPLVGSVVPGFTTLFDAAADPSITYYMEARNGPAVGTCWAWGHDPGYFSWCEAL